MNIKQENSLKTANFVTKMVEIKKKVETSSVSFEKCLIHSLNDNKFFLNFKKNWNF